MHIATLFKRQKQSGVDLKRLLFFAKRISLHHSLSLSFFFFFHVHVVASYTRNLRHLLFPLTILLIIFFRHPLSITFIYASPKLRQKLLRPTIQLKHLQGKEESVRASSFFFVLLRCFTSALSDTFSLTSCCRGLRRYRRALLPLNTYTSSEKRGEGDRKRGSSFSEALSNILLEHRLSPVLPKKKIIIIIKNHTLHFFSFVISFPASLPVQLLVSPLTKEHAPSPSAN